MEGDQTLDLRIAKAAGSRIRNGPSTVLERVRPARMCFWSLQISFGVIACIAQAILKGRLGCSRHAKHDGRRSIDVSRAKIEGIAELSLGDPAQRVA